MADTAVQLKVAEANPRDVGRGLARVDPEVMAKLCIDASGVNVIIGCRNFFPFGCRTRSSSRLEGSIVYDR